VSFRMLPAKHVTGRL